VLAYKFLRTDAVGPFSGFPWPVPAGDEPGPWVAADRLVMCSTGVHACRVAHLPYWSAEELWVVELDGDIVEGPRKITGHRGRLHRRVEAWTRASAIAFAEDCAWRVRDLAVEVGREAGDEDGAARLRACRELASVVDVGGALARAGKGVPSLIARYAADAAHFTLAGDLVAVPLIAAVAASDAAAGGKEHDTSSPAFAAERTRQAAWFTETFGLTDEPGPA
jgi:hypothetical protein